jgi:alginate O-acetyltransferase complex protein AlgI
MHMQELINALSYFPGHPMVFHSVLFFIAFALFYLLYAFTHNRIQFRNALLLIFSLFFYYKISGLYVGLLAGIATFDYMFGRLIHHAGKKYMKRLLVFLSLLISIGSLVFFKYLKFLIETWFGITNSEPSFEFSIIMPVGISYYVFKTVSYIIDVYRGIIEKPEKNYISYMVYVSFFPNILAGPIARARDLLPQINGRLNIDRKMISLGFFLVLSGAFKKIFIADAVASNLVDRVFDSFAYFGGFEILMAAYGYTIQLYFDFSGYTDMVIGLALLLGFSTAPNFNKPFLAGNVTEFWRRWHMTLSSWLRDYLFSPMTIRMRYWGKAGLVIAVLLTFIICGIWHGPNITFIVWGALHGIAMAWDIITAKARKRIRKTKIYGVYHVASIIVTFHFLVLTFMVFRSKTIDDAWMMIQKMFTSFHPEIALQWVQAYSYPFAIMIFGLLLHFSPVSWNTALQNMFTKIHWSLKALLIGIAVVIIYQAFSTEAQPFIYLDF